MRRDLETWWDTPAVTRFIERAREYCELIRLSEGRPKVALAHDLHKLLPLLYVDALVLPEAPEQHFKDGDAEREAEERIDRALSMEQRRELLNRLSLQFGKTWDKYRDVTDPYDASSQEANYGWLSDDLTDVFGELVSGLAAWDAGYRGHAVWDLKFMFERHWGQHVLGALVAIRTLAELYDLGYPPAPRPAG